MTTPAKTPEISPVEYDSKTHRVDQTITLGLVPPAAGKDTPTVRRLELQTRRGPKGATRQVRCRASVYHQDGIWEIVRPFADFYRVLFQGEVPQGNERTLRALHAQVFSDEAIAELIRDATAHYAERGEPTLPDEAA